MRTDERYCWANATSKAKPIKKDVQRADKSMDVSYKSLLSAMSLSKSRRENLLMRGLSDEEIKKFGRMPFGKSKCRSVMSNFRALKA